MTTVVVVKKAGQIAIAADTLVTSGGVSMGQLDLLKPLLEIASIAGNYPSALLGWADSGSTKTHAVSICGDGRSGLISPTGYSSWTFSGAPAFTRDGRRVWLRFSDDGTAIAVQWSISGVYWYTLYSRAKASSHLGAAGYNRLFFGASSSSITGVATLLSWSIS